MITRHLRPALTLFVMFFALTGFGYPLLVLALGQHLMPFEANGSLIVENNTIRGSRLLGQNFSSDRYFHGRPSLAGEGYDAANSSGSNAAVVGSDFLKTIQDRATAMHHISSAHIPVDLVTASASGLDPDISIDAANFQAVRVAEARGLNPLHVEEFIKQKTTSRSLGFLGENRVNVLDLNRALDQLQSLAHE